MRAFRNCEIAVEAMRPAYHFTCKILFILPGIAALLTLFQASCAPFVQSIGSSEVDSDFPGVALLGLLGGGASVTPGNEAASADSPPTHAGLSGASALFLADDPALNDAASGGMQLFKLTADEAVEVVSFRNEEGGEADVSVSEIRKLSDNYIAATLHLPGSDSITVLIRRSDGAIFNFSEFDLKYARVFNDTLYVLEELEYTLYRIELPEEREEELVAIPMNNPSADRLIANTICPSGPGCYYPTGQTTEPFLVDSQGYVHVYNSSDFTTFRSLLSPDNAPVQRGVATVRRQGTVDGGATGAAGDSFTTVRAGDGDYYSLFADNFVGDRKSVV